MLGSGIKTVFSSGQELLQSRTLFGEENYRGVLAYIIKFNILIGYRNYTLGKIVLQFPEFNIKIFRNISRIEYTTLGNIRDEDCVKYGYLNNAKFKEHLSKYSSDITEDSALTILTWKE